MMLNTDIFFDFIGRLKLATVVVGLMNLILIGTSYYSWDTRDEAFLAAVVICFVLSFIWVVGVMLEYIVVTDTLIRMDILYHVIASLFLVVTDVFYLISVLKYGNQKENLGYRILAMIFGFINSAIYGYLPWTIVKK